MVEKEEKEVARFLEGLGLFVVLCFFALFIGASGPHRVGNTRFTF